MDTKDAGRLGGLSRSPKKSRASRENGKRNQSSVEKLCNVLSPVSTVEQAPARIQPHAILLAIPKEKV